MAGLVWEIHWSDRYYSLDPNKKKACELAIHEYLLKSGRSFGSQDQGHTIENLTIHLENTSARFSATLKEIDALDGMVKVDRGTEIYARDPLVIRRPTDPSPENELNNFILMKATFDPRNPDPYYRDIYNSLIGTEKEIILQEMISLLAPPQVPEKWALHHYRTIPPILRAAVSKAPVIIFGGDPGTGKTALASSIGVQLSQVLEERVHFWHVSLSMRGMGYQGRAASLIMKFFESLKEEYGKGRGEPMIVFFDEAEAIVGSREQVDESSGAQENVAIVNAIIVGVDNLRKGLPTRIAAVFATNIIGRIDPALMRRCYYYSFERPNEEARRALFSSTLTGLELDEKAIDRLVEATKPREMNGREVAFTHSDIVELIVVRAVHTAIRQDKPVSLDLLLDFCQRTIPTKSLTK